MIHLFFFQIVFHIQAKSESMLSTDSQWLYVVTDTNSQDSDMSPYINMAQDGYNMAFAFNTSYNQDAAECPSGVICLIEELIKLLAINFEKTLIEEEKNFNEVCICT